jgi:D-sedoheptulose 7-phosphate isomerase
MPVSTDFFTTEAQAVAELCRAMASRFGDGGRLLAVGATPAELSDVRHVTVEFVQPVIVGKRALPALGVPDGLELIAEPHDMVIGFGSSPSTLAALAIARERGCLMLDLAPTADDPLVAQELHETLYHVLWELVHVFLEHDAEPIYSFLKREAVDPEAVLADVARSVVMKAAEATELRAQTMADNAGTIEAAAAALRASFDAGGRVLALGNGGSATDAMDVVADLRAARRPALDLTEDTAVITAVANDVGVEAIFSRQVIAHGRRGDVLIAISTSGGSANVIHALGVARKRGLVTIALVGYDGGRILAEGLADHVIVTRSEHIPRIQEAQATAYHELVRRST